MKLRVRYYKTINRNERTGQTTFTASPLDYFEKAEDGIITCIGIVPIFNQGTPLEIDGKFQNDKYIISDCQILNHSRDNERLLIEYICNDLTNRQIEKIIDFCDEDLLQTAKTRSKELKIFIQDLLKARQNNIIIAESFITNIKILLNSETLTKVLLSIDVPLDKISKLISKRISYEQIINSPYYFFLKFDISISYADELLLLMNKLDENKYSFARLCGFVYGTMLKEAGNGNTCITFDDLCKKTQYLLNSQGKIETKINKAIINTCVMGMPEILNYHKINNEVYIYLNSIWDEESIIVENVKRLKNGSRKVEKTFKIENIENELNIQYNAGQKNAFNILNSTGIKILTGPPGSGKTAVLKGIIKAFNMGKRGVVRLAATTGMAAKIMAKSTGDSAQTVNKMLDVIPFEDTIMRNETNRLEADLIIVDEVSMLGLQLASVLFSAIKSNATLILVGDEDQLASVDYGNVLADLISSNEVEVYRLTEIMRQKGSICSNAMLINSHKDKLINDNSFIAYECSSIDIMQKLFDEYYTKDTQVLCPVKNGDISVNSYNDKLQDKTSPILLEYGHKTIRYKDKVVMTKTSYDDGFINGDIGYAIELTNDGLKIELLNGEIVVVPREYYGNVELAYCLTIHKSQGSEYEKAIILLPDTVKCMLTTRLIYTAVTRAKKNVIIISMNNATHDAISNIYENKRITKLDKRLETLRQN